MKPIVADLYCGLGGWAEGFIAEGYEAHGYDIEPWPYPGALFLRDVLNLHGREIADADVIVASPPCQEPSYRAMPWKRAKALNVAGPPHKFIALFEACFRIQREASEAAGRHIPMIVEDVVGAQRWVGRAKWHFGSYYLWGDVPALMPVIARTAMKFGASDRFKTDGEVSPYWRMEAMKNPGHLNIRDGHTHTRHLTNPAEHGVKQHGSGSIWFDRGVAAVSSKSSARKAASAQIAKIPFPLARHIARVYKPQEAVCR